MLLVNILSRILVFKQERIICINCIWVTQQNIQLLNYRKHYYPMLLEGQTELFHVMVLWRLNSNFDTKRLCCKHLSSSRHSPKKKFLLYEMNECGRQFSTFYKNICITYGKKWAVLLTISVIEYSIVGFNRLHFFNQFSIFILTKVFNSNFYDFFFFFFGSFFQLSWIIFAFWLWL